MKFSHLAALAVVLGLAAAATAADPPKAFTPPVAWDEARIQKIEKDVAELKAALKPETAAAARPVATTAGSTQVVPAGHHAHTRTDGTTIIHPDHTGNDAAAHAGVAWPWYKSAVAGQTVTNVVSGPAVAASTPGLLGSSFTATNGVTYVADPGRPGVFVPAGRASTPAVGTVSEMPRMRQLTLQTPLMTGRVCIGGNCPR